MLPGIQQSIFPPWVFLCFCNDFSAICGEKLCFLLKEFYSLTISWERFLVGDIFSESFLSCLYTCNSTFLLVAGVIVKKKKKKNRSGCTNSLLKIIQWLPTVPRIKPNIFSGLQNPVSSSCCVSLQANLTHSPVFIFIQSQRSARFSHLKTLALATHFTWNGLPVKTLTGLFLSIILFLPKCHFLSVSILTTPYSSRSSMFLFSSLCFIHRTIVWLFLLICFFTCLLLFFSVCFLHQIVTSIRVETMSFLGILEFPAPRVVLGKQ